MNNKCGHSCFYNFEEQTGTLTISGTGDMYNYGLIQETAPWSEYRDKIQEVKLLHGVTSIGGATFYGCTNLKKVTVKGILFIEDMAFNGCEKLESISALKYVTHIGVEAFKGCKSLKEIDLLSFITVFGDSQIFEGVSSDFVLKCQKDSDTEKYAKTYKLNYEIG